MIKKAKEIFDESERILRLVMPSFNYKIEADDILVLFGTEEKIAKTSRMVIILDLSDNVYYVN